MKHQTAIPTGEQASTLVKRGLRQHTAVHAGAEHERAPDPARETRFNHDFSQAAVRPLAPMVGQRYATSACPVFPRTCPFGGACHTCPLPVQAKLKVNQPGDRYEREADRVAEQVMRISEPTGPGAGVQIAHVTSKGRDAIQFQSELAQEESSPEDEDTEPDTEEVLQTKSLSSRQLQATFAVHRLPAQSKVSGQPLPGDTRGFMEQRFGIDFGHIRVHAGPDASRMSRALHARAFTHGSDVYFDSGEYRPSTHSGRMLLAHELVHTVQQSDRNIRRRVVTDLPDVRLHTDKTIQRSQALYFSTHGRQGYFRFAERFHRARGFPAPVRVSSVEQMLAHMRTLTRPIDFVRIVTHAVPAGIWLPLLQGGSTSLFQQDMALQGTAGLERELAVEHPTIRQRGQYRVVMAQHHIVPRDWIRQSWLEINWTPGGPEVLIEHRYLLGNAPDADRGPLPDLEMHSFFWWILDRELLSAQHEQVDRKGRRRMVYTIPMQASQRQTLLQSINRNIDIFRSRLMSTGWGTRESLARLEAMIATVAPRLIDRELRDGLNVQYALPSQRYESVQGALERGTYSDNLLWVKYAMANGAEFQIRGCRIGQNVGWLETFRDFFGHGEGQNRSRPHVSAPRLRHAFGIRRRRRRGRTVTQLAEWLQDRRRRIFPENPQFEANIVHVR